MSVRSKNSSVFIYKNKRYPSKQSAEVIMQGEDILHERLQQVESDTSNEDEKAYVYGIPYEPFLHAGEDQTLICGTQTVLDSTITGVPLSDLIVEWEQLSGLVASIENPFSEDSILDKSSGDSSDKAFSIKTTNLNTGVVNIDKVSIYGSPTEKTSFDGKGYLIRYREGSNTSEVVFDLAPNGPIPGPDGSNINPDRTVEWETPPDVNNLVAIELLENSTGQYVAIASVGPDNNSINIPINRNQSVSYRINFVYNLNGVVTSIWSKNVLYTGDAKYTLAEEKTFVSGIYTGYVAETLRVISANKLEEDPFNTNQVWAGTKYGETTLLYSTDSARYKHKNLTTEFDLLNTALHGIGLYYATDTERADRNVIGGG